MIDPEMAAALEALLDKTKEDAASADFSEIDRGVSTCRDGGAPELLARLLCVRSVLWGHKAGFAEALQDAREAEALLSGRDANPAIPTVLDTVGRALSHLGHFGEALRYFTQSAQAAERFKDKAGLVRSQLALGVLLGAMRSFESADAALQKGLELSGPFENRSAWTMIVNNRIQLSLNAASSMPTDERRQHHLRLATSLLTDEWLAAVKKQGPARRRAMLDTVAQWHLLCGRPDVSRQMCIENLALAEANGLTLAVRTTKIHLAQALIGLGRPQEALDTCRPIVEQFHDRLESGSLSIAYLAISKAHEALGQTAAAFEAYRQFHHVLAQAQDNASQQLTRYMESTIELERSKAEAVAYRKIAVELEEARVLAEAGSRAKSDFLANMSHELRTPLNAIIGFSDLMKSELYGPLSARYLDYLNDIQNSGQHLLELINQVLDLSKAEAGKLDLQEESFDLHALLRATGRLMQPQAAKAGITLALVDLTGKRAALADPLRIRQGVLNILSNALKFTLKDGRVSLSVEPADDTIDITVRDNGPGLRPEETARLFDRFEQAENARGTFGTGLGLSLTRQLLELHGGTIRFESAPGVGSIVRLCLPRSRFPV